MNGHTVHANGDAKLVIFLAVAALVLIVISKFRKGHKK